MPASAPDAVRWKRTPAHQGSAPGCWGWPCRRSSSGPSPRSRSPSPAPRSSWAPSGTLTLAFTVAVTATAYAVAGVRAATKVPLARRRVGNSVTRPDTEGVSTTVCRADADMLSLWDAPVNSPALRWGA